MPFKDKETQREYNRLYQRQRRAGMHRQGTRTSQSQRTACQPLAILAAPYRIEKAKDLLSILEDAINAVREDDTATALQRARTLGYLVSVGIRVIETANLEGRIEALERVFTFKRGQGRLTRQIEQEMGYNEA